jgi:hypothetical protein
MPFPIIFGLPEETPRDVVRKIRREIINALAKATGLDRRTIRPFFPKDLAGDPETEQDDTIYCRLDSGMFLNSPVGARGLATLAIATIIWQAFSGKFETEVLIGDLDGAGKTLLKPALTQITFDGTTQEVVYRETDTNVAAGVVCDSYAFVIDPTSKDLAIITIGPGFNTPLQRVINGPRTVEGYVSGSGVLIVIASNGEYTRYLVGGDSPEFSIDVLVGEQMQWEACSTQLVVFEVCFPPYEPGRFENM